MLDSSTLTPQLSETSLFSLRESLRKTQIKVSHSSKSTRVVTKTVKWMLTSTWRMSQHCGWLSESGTEMFLVAITTTWSSQSFQSITIKSIKSTTTFSKIDWRITWSEPSSFATLIILTTSNRFQVEELICFPLDLSAAFPTSWVSTPTLWWTTCWD